MGGEEAEEKSSYVNSVVHMNCHAQTKRQEKRRKRWPVYIST